MGALSNLVVDAREASAGVYIGHSLAGVLSIWSLRRGSVTANQGQP